MKQKLLHKTMLLLCALVVGSSSVWADTYTMSIDSGTKNGTKDVHWTSNNATLTHSNVSWSASFSGGSITNSNSYVQIGSQSNPFNTITLSTSGISGTITEVKVGCGAYQSKASVAVTVGGNAFGGNAQSVGAAPSSTTACAQNTFSGSASGEIIITITKGTGGRAGYIDYVSVTYTPSGGGSSSVAQPTFNPVGGDYTTAQSVEIDCETIGATVYYTMTDDGTTPDDPTKSDDAYTSAISVTKSGTKIKAKAFKDGMTASSIASATYTIKPNAPVFNLENGSYLKGTKVTLTADYTIYYNITTNGDTPDNPTTSSSTYSDPIDLNDAITYKIKAITYDANGNASDVAYGTFTGVAPTTLPFNWAGGTTTAFQALTGVVGHSLGDYKDNDSNRPYLIQFNGDGDYIEIFTDVKPVKVTIDVKMIGGGTTSTITVQESTNGATFTDVEELTISGSQNDVLNLETSNDFAATTRVVKLLFTKGSNVGVGPISISCDPVPVTISAAEYATYCNATKALDFSTTGITVYTATDNETNVTLNEITSGKIPANTPVVLHKAGADGTAINVPVVASADALAGTNDLHVSTGTDVPNMYVLSKKKGVVGFYKWAGTDLSAGKIYLQAKSSYAPDYMGFGDITTDEGETTGIKAIDNSQLTIDNVYNLNGQRVSQPTKGLYIVNGRKVVIK